jgi:Ca2+-binding EF-hand superfamily protein
MVTKTILTLALLLAGFSSSAPDAYAQQDAERARREQQREQRREQLREQMREKWQRSDQDSSGGISKQQAERNLPRLNERFDAIDRNRDGALTPDEIRSFRQQRQEQQRERLRQRIERADTDASGTISRAEAQRRMPRVYEHFDEIDTDHDGSVSQEEIRAFWRKRAQERRIERGAPDPRF